VSENPVYVLGDYNTKQKVPAAIMGDAITVLSKNWKGEEVYDGNEDPTGNDSDNKGNQSGSNRQAKDTTVNAAFALGPGAESTMGLGNGQLENSIRFLEDWSGKTFTYSGSIISLWHSLQATGQWVCCNYYSPPRRDWSYDTTFSATPPPGTPRGIIMMKGRWSQQ
jgi:hypothetical protein